MKHKLLDQQRRQLILMLMKPLMLMLTVGYAGWLKRGAVGCHRFQPCKSRSTVSANFKLFTIFAGKTAGQGDGEGKERARRAYHGTLRNSLALPHTTHIWQKLLRRENAPATYTYAGGGVVCAHTLQHLEHQPKGSINANIEIAKETF